MKTTIKNKKKPTNFKDAVVEQIILWIVIFTSFVSFLFFIIDYSNALKVNENADAISAYAARMVALNEEDADIVAGINNIKGDYVQTLQASDLSCTESSSVENRQVIMNVYATLDNSFLPSETNNVHSKIVVFNESSAFQKECNITLTLN